jgi:hypothetical protein
MVNGVGYQESVRRHAEAKDYLNKLRKEAEEEIAAQLKAEELAA